jgi:LDH2 family malate/lactate/ureidoglycolate dehydrogenase
MEFTMSSSNVTDRGADRETASSAAVVRIPIEDARALGERALRGTGYSAEDVALIVDGLLDADLCGYRGSGLAKILSILNEARRSTPHRRPTVTYETEASASIDGGNMVGIVPVYRAMEIAIEKARKCRLATVGVYNAYFSGRNAYYLEKIAAANLIGMQTCSGPPKVVPPGATAPALGTNPIGIGMPSSRGPVIIDISTAAMRFSETTVRGELDEELPEGVAIDAAGRPTRSAKAALAGGFLPFGGHRGYALSFAVQALGVLAGARRARGRVQDFAFLFIVLDPRLLAPADTFREELTELVDCIKATRRAPGGEEIRVPSERAFRERERNRSAGTVPLSRRLYEALGSVARHASGADT